MFLETNIKDCFLISPLRLKDQRGFFQETYEQEKYRSLPETNWRQSNWSCSSKNVLRGIHCAQYAKLVTCVKGAIWDVVVDLRPSSSTYKQFFYSELSEHNGRQMYVPSGCGHGFLSLEEGSAVFYLQSGLFGLLGEESYRYDSFGIDWPVCDGYILSDRDTQAKVFE